MDYLLDFSSFKAIKFAANKDDHTYRSLVGSLTNPFYIMEFSCSFSKDIKGIYKIHSKKYGDFYYFYNDFEASKTVICRGDVVMIVSIVSYQKPNHGQAPCSYFIESYNKNNKVYYQASSYNPKKIKLSLVFPNNCDIGHNRIGIWVSKGPYNPQNLYYILKVGHVTERKNLTKELHLTHKEFHYSVKSNHLSVIRNGEVRPAATVDLTPKTFTPEYCDGIIDMKRFVSDMGLVEEIISLFQK